VEENMKKKDWTFFILVKVKLKAQLRTKKGNRKHKKLIVPSLPPPLLGTQFIRVYQGACIS